MQYPQSRTAARGSREEGRRQYASFENPGTHRERRLSGEPAKYNTRAEQRRIGWENDLYERQSM